MITHIKNIFFEQSNLLIELAKSNLPQQIEEISDVVVTALNSGNKVLIAGNGGSAADSQHFSAELVGRFMKERKGLPAIALTTDTSILTSVANDYSFDVIFSRQIEALGNPGDVFIGFSTSGNSENILRAVSACKEEELITIGFLGKDGGQLASLCDYSVIVPSNTTARVQEIHEIIIHLICEEIENKLF